MNATIKEIVPEDYPQKEKAREILAQLEGLSYGQAETLLRDCRGFLYDCTVAVENKTP